MPKGIYERKPGIYENRKPPCRKSLEERFWVKVDKTLGQGPWGDCWIWQAYKNDLGYGEIGIGGTTGRNEGAHRVSWMLEHKENPGDKYVCHKCDTPSCVNPNHLFLGSQKDNMADMRKKGRAFNNTGERHPKAKLSALDVKRIKLMVINSTEKSVAKEFGVSRSTISAIKHKRIWKHLGDTI